MSALGCQEGALRHCSVPPLQWQDGCQLPGKAFLQGAEAALLRSRPKSQQRADCAVVAQIQSCCWGAAEKYKVMVPWASWSAREGDPLH